LEHHYLADQIELSLTNTRLSFMCTNPN
jgi:hypothetical protein